MPKIIRHENNWYWGKSITFITNKCTGFVTVSIYNDTDDFCYVHGLSVLPEQRKQGIGDYLLDVAEQFAIENNIKKIIIDADKRDKWIKDWYKRRGYKVYSYGKHLYHMIKNT